MQAAAYSSGNDIVKLLLDAKADVNITGGTYNIAGGTYGAASQAAILRGHNETVHLLLEAEADVNLVGAPTSQAVALEGVREIWTKIGNSYPKQKRTSIL